MQKPFKVLAGLKEGKMKSNTFEMRISGTAAGCLRFSMSSDVAKKGSRTLSVDMAEKAFVFVPDPEGNSPTGTYVNHEKTFRIEYSSGWHPFKREAAIMESAIVEAELLEDGTIVAPFPEFVPMKKPRRKKDGSANVGKPHEQERCKKRLMEDMFDGNTEDPKRDLKLVEQEKDEPVNPEDVSNVIPANIPAEEDIVNHSTIVKAMKILSLAVERGELELRIGPDGKPIGRSNQWFTAA